MLARIDGEAVTMTDVREQVGQQLGELDFQYRSQRHQLVESALERIVRDRLLRSAADRRGVSVEQLISAHTDSITVSSQEIEGWYRQNQAALGGRSLDELYSRIEEFLVASKRERALAELAGEFEAERDVEYLLEPFRVDLDNEGSPAKGPSDAPITLTEFSDFECPYCGRFFPTLERLQEEYGDRLRVVYRQYPLQEIHPNAYQAALASLCAYEQGKFWEMHDLLFSEQDSLDEDALKEKAARLDLDEAEFASCLSSQRYAEQIERDMQEGDRVGVDGTPALFVNGMPVPGGAVPYEVIAELIEEELERKR